MKKEGGMKMNEFYEDLMCPVVYRWVKNHEGVKICHNKCCYGCPQRENVLNTQKFEAKKFITKS